MLFTLSTDPEFSALAEHTESRRLRLADSWAPKSRFPLPFQNFPRERADPPFGKTAQETAQK